MGSRCSPEEIVGLAILLEVEGLEEVELTLTALSDHHQLTLILDVLGTPSLDDFYAISSHRSRDC